MTAAPDLLAPAQTNLRLYEELRRAGRDVTEIVAARRAYDLAVRLFAGQHRASGKPFVAHLVGVASILAHLGERGPVVVAGLLHAAYSQGAFPGWRRAVTDAKRAAVRTAAGVDAELLVLRYDVLPWNATALDRLGGGLATLPALDRDVVVMRLANELEDLVDLGGAYTVKPFGLAERAVELAAALGYPALAEALDRAGRDSRNADLPAGLASDRRRSFLVAPATHRERIGLRVGRRLARLWHRLSS